MNFQTLLYEVKKNVCAVTLNRPEVYNALNEKMKQELNDALKEAERDHDVRCVLIRGAGEKAFCSGQDLKEHSYSGGRRSLKESLEKSYNPIIRRMRSMEKPIVGMINGVAAGAGLSIALACDMRVMADHAKLIEVFVRIGLVPDSGSHWFLPRLVGLARAFEYSALGNEISAAEAERVGLVNKIVPPGELERTCRELSERLAAAPTKAIGLMKRTFNKSMTFTLDELLEYEAVMQEIASTTEDHTEGVAAFLEKRLAVFKGR